MLVLACSAALVDGQCPDGSAAWVELPASVSSGVTPEMITPVLGSIVLLWALAFGIRIVVRTIRG